MSSMLPSQQVHRKHKQHDPQAGSHRHPSSHARSGLRIFHRFTLPVLIHKPHTGPHISLEYAKTASSSSVRLIRHRFQLIQHLRIAVHRLQIMHHSRLRLRLRRFQIA